MNRMALLLLAFLAVGASAQGTNGEVTMSTDPAKAAAVESHARELQARQAHETTPKSSASSKSTAKAQSATHAKSVHHAKSSTHAKTGMHASHKASASKPTKSAKS